MQEYAGQKNMELWESGGTVTFTAIDFAVRFGSKSIYLVGLDLSYPGGMSHATETTNRKKADLNNLFPIEGVGGKTIYTDTVFYTFLQSIEYLVEKNKDVNFYNMSKIGARIRGTKECEKNGGF